MSPVRYKLLWFRPQGEAASGARPESAWCPVWRPFDGTWGFKNDKWDVKLSIETLADIGCIELTSHERELLTLL